MTTINGHQREFDSLSHTILVLPASRDAKNERDFTTLHMVSRRQSCFYVISNIDSVHTNIKVIALNSGNAI